MPRTLGAFNYKWSIGKCFRWRIRPIFVDSRRSLLSCASHTSKLTKEHFSILTLNILFIDWFEVHECSKSDWLDCSHDHEDLVSWGVGLWDLIISSLAQLTTSKLLYIITFLVAKKKHFQRVRRRLSHCAASCHLRPETTTRYQQSICQVKQKCLNVRNSLQNESLSGSSLLWSMWECT